jgi:glycosyltransferase involved in cell wall biosynthesis
VAAILADSLLFVSLNFEEGLPRMPLEAMLSGCLVVTPDAGPLKESVPRESRFESGDLLAMAMFIERVMEGYPAHLQQWEAVVQRQRAAALAFSLERQAQSVVQAWDAIRRAQPGRRDVLVMSNALPAERRRQKVADAS